MLSLKQWVLKPHFYLAIVILGSLLKFYHLGYKLFWRDEVSTVLYTSGIKEKDYLFRVPTNMVTSSNFYDSLLRPSTNPHAITYEIGQILSDTHLTPGHYVLLTFWYRLVGDNGIDFRLFSVFVFLLSLPFLFMLAKDLMQSSLAAWITISLFSVSPFINFHAQEARYYPLWVFLFILSNYLFLTAINRNKPIWWVAYSLSAVLALYTTLLSAAFVFGHLVFITMFHKGLLKRFLLPLLLVFLAYLPWLYFLLTIRKVIESGLSWQVYDHPNVYTLEYLFFQFLGWSRSFNFLGDGPYYFMLFSGNLLPEIYLPLTIDVIALGFIFYALAYFLKNSTSQTKGFLVLIAMPLFLLIYISDIIRNGLVSLMWRYQIVNLVVIMMIVANILKDKLINGKLSFAGIYLCLIAIGIWSIIKVENLRYWLVPDSPSIINVSKTINLSPNPLIITDFGGTHGYGFVNFLTVIHEAKNKNADILYCKEPFSEIHETISRKNYSDVFIIQSTDELVKKFQASYGEKLVLFKHEKNAWASIPIWKIKP